MYLGEVLAHLIETGVTTVPRDVHEALQWAMQNERNRLAREQLSLILKNIELAKKNRTPLCQDTGIPVFYVRVGRRCDHIFDIEHELAKAVEACTKKSILRPNVVDPLSRENAGTNVGPGIPVVHYSLFDGDHLEITFVPKGAGTENVGGLFMLNPGDGEREVESAVIRRVKEMGGRPCPPYVIGIGLGGTTERCMELAKIASTRSIGSKSHDYRLARLEKRIRSAVNKTGIGPMGLGGNTTCLAVHIESAGCHTATMPVGFAVSCWADRRSKVILRKHGHFWVD